jgi:hypothetical protein
MIEIKWWICGGLLDLLVSRWMREIFSLGSFKLFKIMKKLYLLITTLLCLSLCALLAGCSEERVCVESHMEKREYHMFFLGKAGALFVPDRMVEVCDKYVPQ